MEYEQIFREWLLNEKEFKEASVKDIISRLKRVTKLTDLNFEDSYDEIVAKLNDTKEFKQLSTFVQPQIKRAIRLYKIFSEQIKAEQR